MSLKKYSLYLFAASLLLGGCKKQLDLNDPESISADNAFQTFDHVYGGTNGAYANYGAYAGDLRISGLVSDESRLGVNNAGQGALTFRYQYSADNTTGGDVIGAYFNYYAMIDHINRVLPHVYTVSATPAQELIRDRTKAELLALRAVAHFSLLKIYSKNYDPAGVGVSIMTESDPLAKPARATMGEVMTQIEKDLADAKLLMPALTAAAFRDTAMNKINIAAFQARVALYKKDYANAITYATEVINTNARPLVAPADYADIWTDVNVNAEVLLRIRYSTSGAIGGLWNAGSTIYIAPSNKLESSYSSDDVRKAAFIGHTGAGDPYLNKYWISGRGPGVVDLKVIRTAEMYLIRAEANAMKTSPDLVAGAADINLVRSRRIPSYINQTFATAADLLSATLQERFKELCFEGQRLWDLKRNNLPVQRNAADASAAWQTLPNNSFRFTLPIPQDARNSNPNTIQNEGY